MSTVSDEGLPEKSRECHKAGPEWQIGQSMQLERLVGPCTRTELLKASTDVFQASINATVNHPDNAKYANVGIDFFVGWFEQIYLRLEHLVSTSRKAELANAILENPAMQKSDSVKPPVGFRDQSKPLE